MDIKAELSTKAEPILSHLKDELAGLRTNRPSPALVENITVKYFEEDMKVQHLGSIGVVPPRQILITCWDENAVLPIAQAIEKSNLGVSAVPDGKIVRVNLPALTDDRRKELEKLAKKLSEESRISVRHLRDDMNKKIESDFKEKAITEDEKFRLKEEVQDETKKLNTSIDDMLERKIAEINE